MRKLLISIIIANLLVIPVSATVYSPPAAPGYIEKYMPKESVSFGKDLWYIIKSALSEVTPEISESLDVCACVFVAQLLVAMIQNFAGIGKKPVTLAGVVAISILLLSPSKAIINLGTESIQSISEYNKLLLPVMTAALAAQGGATTSAALYAGTVVLDTLLTQVISKLILPMVYAYLALGIASAAIGEPILNNLLGLLKWFITWMLKISIYLFTGYMGITGVISGTVDAAALKATKLAISGAVPVIGNVISDASETLLVSAGVVKNTVGIYGALVILTMWILPFLKIGIQYLMLKIVAGLSALYAEKKTTLVVEHVTTVMGFILAITGTVCLLFLVSMVCFMKGMSG